MVIRFFCKYPASQVCAIVATGRSDFPNQINKCSCLPGVFKGALDAGARCRITEGMKLAAAEAILSVVVATSWRRTKSSPAH